MFDPERPKRINEIEIPIKPKTQTCLEVMSFRKVGRVMVLTGSLLSLTKIKKTRATAVKTNETFHMKG